jgi:hypothetical protein
MSIKSRTTLGVTWFSTTTDEADMALNTNFAWDIGGANGIDPQTVFLHENGHALGLGHSDVGGSIMEPVYAGLRLDLHQDDIDGISSLYPNGPVNQAPTVTIGSPTDGGQLASGAPVNFLGTASDAEDGNITGSLVWTSDGVQIGTGGSFSATLADGNHLITATVTDLDGRTSSESVSITVGTPVEATTVSVDSISYSLNGGKTKDRNLSTTIALLDDFGNPPSGASVSIKLTNTTTGAVWTGTAATAENGTATFSLRNAPAGAYTTTVTNVSAAGLTWNGDNGSSVDPGVTKSSALSGRMAAGTLADLPTSVDSLFQSGDSIDGNLADVWAKANAVILLDQTFSEVIDDVAELSHDESHLDNLASEDNDEGDFEADLEQGLDLDAFFIGFPSVNPVL